MTFKQELKHLRIILVRVNLRWRILKVRLMLLWNFENLFLHHSRIVETETTAWFQADKTFKGPVCAFQQLLMFKCVLQTVFMQLDRTSHIKVNENTKNNHCSRYKVGRYGCLLTSGACNLFKILLLPNYYKTNLLTIMPIDGFKCWTSGHWASHPSGQHQLMLGRE